MSNRTWIAFATFGFCLQWAFCCGGGLLLLGSKEGPPLNDPLAIAPKLPKEAKAPLKGKGEAPKLPEPKEPQPTESIWWAFVENEARAEALYAGKRYSFGGLVKSITKTAGGFEVYFQGLDSSRWEGTYCHFTNPADIAVLQANLSWAGVEGKVLRYENGQKILRVGECQLVAHWQQWTVQSGGNTTQGKKDLPLK